MRPFGPNAAYVIKHPAGFALRVLRAFRANQGLLLAGAVAYYTLLSIVPLLILLVIALSQIIDPGELLATLGRYLEWLIPGQSTPVIGELARFLDHREVIGWVLLVTMVFFSTLCVHGSGKRDGGHLPASHGAPPAPLPRVRGDSLLRHFLCWGWACW